MTLESWRTSGWLRDHDASEQELDDQLEAARRDLKDADSNISPSWRFAIAYNAALRLCDVVLAAAGYQANREQKHYRTIAALPHVIGEKAAEISRFLDRCRARRHQVTYEALDPVSESEARELIDTVHELEGMVTRWLQARRTRG